MKPSTFAQLGLPQLTANVGAPHVALWGADEATHDPFTVSNEILGHPAALRERMRSDGYLFLRGLVDPTRLATLREAILSICNTHGWLDPAHPIAAGVPLGPPRLEGQDAYAIVYDDVQRLEPLHRLAHLPTITNVMAELVDPPLLVHPLAVSRLMFPRCQEFATPPHQDYPNNQGAVEMYAVWIPLGSCPRQLGGIAVLTGSHHYGVLPAKASLGAGYRSVIPNAALASLRWVSGDFAPGDVLIFHALTVHRSLANRTDRLRLSVDYRYSSAAQPVSNLVLEPHFGRLDWEDIYRGWKSREGCYYWRDLPLRVVPFDPAMLSVVSPDSQQAVVDSPPSSTCPSETAPSVLRKGWRAFARRWFAGRG